MTLADIKRIIDEYLAIDQPDAKTAVKEVNRWLRNRQWHGDIHSYSVRLGYGLSSPVSRCIHVDVQIVSTGSPHALKFDESKWLKSSKSRGSKVTTLPVSIPDTPEDAYDRAMRGI